MVGAVVYPRLRRQQLRHRHHAVRRRRLDGGRRPLRTRRPELPERREPPDIDRRDAPRRVHPRAGAHPERLRPGPRPDEQPAAELVAEQMRSFGWTPSSTSSRPAGPTWSPSSRVTGRGRRCMFEGHTDVVTEGDPALDASIPFGAELRDGRIWGRGSADMKAGVAAMLFAADAARSASGSFPGRIVLAALVDEEGMMAGAKHFVARGRADGRRRRDLLRAGGRRDLPRRQGRAAAARRPHRRDGPRRDAVPGPQPEPGRRRSAAAPSPSSSIGSTALLGEHPYLGRAWMTPTVLRAGEPVQMNVMPADASLWIDVRTIPAIDHADARRRAPDRDRAGRRRRRRRRRRST